MKDEIFQWQKTVAQLATSKFIQGATVVFLRKQGLWIIPYGKGITAWARGSAMGIKGDVKILPQEGDDLIDSVAGPFIAQQNAAQFVGSGLMNGTCFELVLLAPGKAKVRTFGMLREGKWRTIPL